MTADAVPIAVVIPSWNGRSLLGTCLAALLEQVGWRDEVIVVDNGSDDGTAEFVGQLPNVRLICLERNHGFAAAVNRGIEASGAPWVALLNNDAVVQPGWLEALRKRAATCDEAVGFVSSMLLTHDGRVIDSTGDGVTWFGDVFSVGRGRTDLVSFGTSRPIFSASGGASAYRRTMLQDVGLFASEFFAYYEDVDLCFRAQWRGWTGVYEPRAVVRHVMGATSTRNAGMRERLSFRNHVRLYVRSVANPWRPLSLALFIRVLVRNLVALPDRRSRFAALRGLGQAMCQLPRYVEERKQLVVGRLLTPDEVNRRIDETPNVTASRRDVPRSREHSSAT